MKKFFTFVFAIALGINVFAQCPITTAVDFTATDCHGTEVHLFDILDGGQYVLIDFFYYSCSYCQQSAPKIVESYYSLGCNMHDVFYMEISDRDNDALCQTWTSNYGVEYPTISGAAGGAAINDQYGISAYPTIILIAPDHSIVENDIWPINNAQTMISILGNHGIQQHECAPASSDPEVTITVDMTTSTEVTVTFTPNTECNEYYYMMATEDEFNQWMATTGLYLPEYLRNYGFPAYEEVSHNFTDLTPETEYMICAVPADDLGNLYDVAQEFITTSPGGNNDIMADFTGTDTDGNEVNLYSILDNGQAVVIFFFLNGDSYSEQPMPYVLESYSAFGCNEHDVFFMEICPNSGNSSVQNWIDNFEVKFPTISRDGGGNDIVQAIPVGFYPSLMIIRPDHTISVRDLYPIIDALTIINALESEGWQQYECTPSVVAESHANDLTLYPNPVKDNLMICGQNLGNVSVCNALGQVIFEGFAAGELNINTSNYPNGVYFVKIGNNTQRCVVTH